MKYFKYCNADVVAKIAGGSLRFSSLAWFRKIELLTGDRVIGDQLEGLAETSIEHLHLAEGPNADQTAALHAMGIHVEGGRNNTFSNIRYVSDCGHLLIFCLSASEELDLEGSGYDACLQVSDIEALRDCIIQTGKINGSIPVNEVFDQVNYGPVRYISRSADALAIRSRLEASPFAKQEQYARQTEHRIVLRPIDEWLPDIQYIQITPPEGLLVPVATGLTEQASTSAAGPSRASVIAALSSLVTETHELQRACMTESAAQQLALHGMSFDARSEAITELARRQMSEFEARFGDRVRSAYWDARALGYRGDWEQVLDDQGGAAFSRCAMELARLVNDMQPGTFTGAWEQGRPARPRRGPRTTAGG